MEDYLNRYHGMGEHQCAYGALHYGWSSGEWHAVCIAQDANGNECLHTIVRRFNSKSKQIPAMFGALKEWERHDLDKHRPGNYIPIIERKPTDDEGPIPY